MSLRHKFILYLAAVHLLFASVAITLLLEKKLLLLAVELVFIISITAGVKLINNLFGTLDVVRTGAQFISDSDFTSRFKLVGQREMDELINVYNRMAEHLRDERVRLQEQNYFLEKVLAASPSGIITFDFDQRIAMANPAALRMLQLSINDTVGKRLPELQTAFATELQELPVGESRVLPLIGRRRVKCQKSQFLDRGFLRNFILIEELTEELRQIEKSAYEKLIRLMSHEVNNSIGSANSLLNSCLNYKDQLQPEDRQDFENALNVVIARTEQLNQFMRGFADVVKLPPLQLHATDVKKLVAGIALLMRAEFSRRKIDIVWKTAPDIEPVAMDRIQMEQVFVNILKNAAEAIGEHGTITIELGKRSGRAFITIEDTGGGISPEARVNLFTPFFSTKEHGQGIGLTLVQEILDRHKFDFSLDGQPGQPTQFTIYF